MSAGRSKVASSLCFKKTVVQDIEQEGTNLKVTRRPLAFSSEIRLLQKRLACGKISTVGLTANLSKKAVSAFHHLQE